MKLRRSGSLCCDYNVSEEPHHPYIVLFVSDITIAFLNQWPIWFLLSFIVRGKIIPEKLTGEIWRQRQYNQECTKKSSFKVKEKFGVLILKEKKKKKETK